MSTHVVDAFLWLFFGLSEVQEVGVDAMLNLRADPMSDALVAMEKAMKRDKITVNDRQLACARITSQEGQDYLKGMAAAGNYAWVNRSSMTFLTRQVRPGLGGLKTKMSYPDFTHYISRYNIHHNLNTFCHQKSV